MDQVITVNENVLDVTFNLKTYLEAEFDFVYNHNNFFIVANNDTPINSLPNTTGEDIWLKIIDYVKELMIEPSFYDANMFYKKLSANFILAYGTHSYLNDKYNVILDKFNRKIIPIHNDAKLDYTYLNNDISITKLDSILWKPVGFNKKYNIILETVLKIIFDTLSIIHDVEWSFENLDNLYLILNRDVEDGYHIPTHYNISKAIKNYIYQVWILVENNKTDILSPQQKKIQELLYKYKEKGIPFNLSDKLSTVYNIEKKVVYRDTTKQMFPAINNDILLVILIILNIILVGIGIRLYFYND
jgi:hypothetical protein